MGADKAPYPREECAAMNAMIPCDHLLAYGAPLREPRVELATEQAFCSLPANVCGLQRPHLARAFDPNVAWRRRPFGPALLEGRYSKFGLGRQPEWLKLFSDDAGAPKK